jgi:hypothetical protein
MDYTIVEKAKGKISFSEEKEDFYPLFFLALRELRCNLKDSVQAVLSEAKENGVNIDYRTVFKNDGEEINSLPLIAELKEDVEYFEEKHGLLPQSGVGHLIWLEVLLSITRDDHHNFVVHDLNGFKKRVEATKRKIITTD